MRVESKKRYPWPVRFLLWLQKRKYGQPLTSSLIWGRSARPFFSLSTLFGALERKSSPIDDKTRSMVRVYISQINHCSFCIDMNGARLHDLGESDERIMALRSPLESPLYNEREKAILSYAREIVRTDLQVSDSTFENVKRFYNDDAIVELTAVIVTQMASSAFNSALKIPSSHMCPLQLEPGNVD